MIRIYFDFSLRRWMSVSDNPSLPERLRLSPVFRDMYREPSSSLEVLRIVRECNPGVDVRHR